jgi:3-(3-hydroxy-phenyl)propionate hydroxylase
MNTAVDFYFTKAKKWQEELIALRPIILSCGLTEELKWGVPSPALNVLDTDTWSSDLTAPGMPAPELLLDDGTHLSEQFGKSFVCLVLSADSEIFEVLEPLKRIEPEQNNIKIYSILGNKYAGYSQFMPINSPRTALLLVRPDGYIMGRWKGTEIAPVLAAMNQTGVSP